MSNMALDNVRTLAADFRQSDLCDASTAYHFAQGQNRGLAHSIEGFLPKALQRGRRNKTKKVAQLQMSAGAVTQCAASGLGVGVGVGVGEAPRSGSLSAGRIPIAAESAGAQTFLQRRGLFMQGKVFREGGSSPALARCGRGQRYTKKANSGPILDTLSLALGGGTCNRTRPLSGPSLAHIKVALAQLACQSG